MLFEFCNLGQTKKFKIIQNLYFLQKNIGVKIFPSLVFALKDGLHIWASFPW